MWIPRSCEFVYNGNIEYGRYCFLGDQKATRTIIMVVVGFVHARYGMYRVVLNFILSTIPWNCVETSTCWDKWGQMGTNEDKSGQMRTNRDNTGQMRTNGDKSDPVELCTDCT